MIRTEIGGENAHRGRATSEAMTVGRWLLVFGFGCLAVVVLTHIAEKLSLFPAMGWGLPDSPGHYLDLTSAVLGTVLLIAGIVVGVYWRRPK
jgi:hypothetical protein